MIFCRYQLSTKVRRHKTLYRLTFPDETTTHESLFLDTDKKEYWGYSGGSKRNASVNIHILLRQHCRTFFIIEVNRPRQTGSVRSMVLSPSETGTEVLCYLSGVHLLRRTVEKKTRGLPDLELSLESRKVRWLRKQPTIY